MLPTKILCVDDEQNILDGLKRQLRNRFEVDVAAGAEIALTKLSEGGPYAVVVSDMRMPNIDGVEFLRRVKKIAPETVRLMLTGNADQESAVRAVNQGNIFRFLTKPCSTEELTKALEDAAAQHRLIVAEKELLQSTLSGSVKLLTDILSFMDPAVFGESMKFREPIKKIALELGVTNSWEIELAGMLSQIGLLTVPPGVMIKFHSGERLSAEEREILGRVPVIGQSLIANIPRLQGVAKIVLYQDKRYDGLGLPGDPVKGEDIPLGARIIKILKDFSQARSAGGAAADALAAMEGRKGWYDPELLATVARVLGWSSASSTEKTETRIYEITSKQFVVGQKLMSSVETKDGVLLIVAGSVITEALLERLLNYSQFVGLKEPIQVDCLMPSRD
jgi:response regulator RpfG family c-di-GMP phosphodiesterase